MDELYQKYIGGWDNIKSGLTFVMLSGFKEISSEGGADDDVTRLLGLYEGFYFFVL